MTSWSLAAAAAVLALAASAAAWTPTCNILCPQEKHPFCTMQNYSSCPASLNLKDLIRRHDPFRAKAVRTWVQSTRETRVGYGFNIDEDAGFWHAEMASVWLDSEKVGAGRQNMTIPAAEVLLDHYLSTLVIETVRQWLWTAGVEMAKLPVAIQSSLEDMWYHDSQLDNDNLKAAFGRRSWVDSPVRCRYCEFVRLLELCLG
eukprot:m51a1_g14294 hypothetical protein (202) ;mRNA; r:420904-421749